MISKLQHTELHAIYVYVPLHALLEFPFRLVILIFCGFLYSLIMHLSSSNQYTVPQLAQETISVDA